MTGHRIPKPATLAAGFQPTFPVCEAVRKPTWQHQGAGVRPAPYCLSCAFTIEAFSFQTANSIASNSSHAARGIGPISSKPASGDPNEAHLSMDRPAVGEITGGDPRLGNFTGRIIGNCGILDQRILGLSFAPVFEEVFLPPAIHHPLGHLRHRQALGRGRYFRPFRADGTHPLAVDGESGAPRRALRVVSSPVEPAWAFATSSLVVAALRAAADSDCFLDDPEFRTAPKKKLDTPGTFGNRLPPNSEHIMDHCEMADRDLVNAESLCPAASNHQILAVSLLRARPRGTIRAALGSGRTSVSRKRLMDGGLVLQPRRR